MKRAHDMPFGAALQGGAEARFRLWAPDEARVVLEVDGLSAVMDKADDGWHRKAVPAATARACASSPISARSR